MSDTPTPFLCRAYYKAIVAFRCGQFSHASHHLLWVVDALLWSLSYLTIHLPPGAAQWFNRLTEARAREDAIALADLLEFELPESGIVDALPVRGLRLTATPADSQRPGEPVALSVETSSARPETLEYRFVIRYHGPDPHGRYIGIDGDSTINRYMLEEDFTTLAPYAPETSCVWRDTDIPGRYLLGVWCRVQGSNLLFCLADNLEYEIR